MWIYIMTVGIKTVLWSLFTSYLVPLCCVTHIVFALEIHPYKEPTILAVGH